MRGMKDMGDVVILGMPIALGTMVYQAVLFTILFWILKKKVLVKVVAIMDKRKETIENQLVTSEKYRKEGEIYLQNQMELLEKARFEAREILRNSQREAFNIVKQAKDEAAAIRTQSYKDALEKRKRDAG
jgi:F-type H+-transporting ATPase subunit b